MLAVYIIAGIILAGIILFIILMLSIAVDMVFDLEVHQDVKVTMRVGWLFGLVWKDIRWRKKKKPKKKKERSMKPLLSMMRAKELPRRLLKLARQLLSCLKVRQLDADFRVGLDNPVDTGMMCSVLCPAIVLLNSFVPMRFRMEPAFDGPTFEGSLHGRIRLFPIQMVGPLLCFVLSPTGLRTLKSMVTSSWKKKR
ncbi:MAG: DUF2953 domain-containing protein [Chloroflexi bacterium]|nr:DUF2953 domain-containing protein [Chloroflexota bacterium]